MLGDNLRELRKQKGMSQEELATRINVVRQTVSKWEKNISVPDAEMLQRIAEELDVSVNQLLGSEEEKVNEKDRNEIAEQLSRINEQLVLKNKRTGRIVKIVLGFIAAAIVLKFAIAWMGMANFKSNTHSLSTSWDISAEDPLYTEAEVQEAMNVLEKYFDDNCKGCTLESIDYSEDDATEEIIILKTDFSTGKKVKLDGAEPEKTYKGWEWVLTKSGSGEWRVQE